MFALARSFWLTLMIGNSRLHWGRFVGESLEKVWDTNHLAVGEVEQLIQGWVSDDLSPTLYLASVVPSQTALWQIYPNTRVITLNQITLQGIYPSLGIDRALAVLGSGETYNYPVLAIDAGTALTFTGADGNRCLMGGAILPGLGLQLKSLTEKTAALPAIELPKQMPQRWALNTPEAIQSGVIYTVLAGIKDFIDDWLCQFPESRITLTGGDRAVLLTYIKSQYPEIAPKLIVDPNLIFWGMRSITVDSY